MSTTVLDTAGRSSWLVHAERVADDRWTARCDELDLYMVEHYRDVLIENIPDAVYHSARGQTSRYINVVWHLTARRA